MHYDYLIVGSGLYGAVFAYCARRSGKKCLVLEKRQHTGGNVFCEETDGISVHKYGAHIFHTSSEKVWSFVNSFAKFNRYTNSPVANFRGKIFNLPFNMNTFYQMWGTRTPEEAQKKIRSQQDEISAEPKNLEEQAIRLVGRDIYETLIKEYTEKQWGRKCAELPAFIIKRLPVRFTFDNNYFDDLYQGIPMGGYNKIISGLLDGIEVKTGCDFFSDRAKFESSAEKIVFTGKIDEFYEFCCGNLEWRTVRFETQKIGVQNFQGNAVVNYTGSEVPFTRIIEHKHFEPERDSYGNPVTIISREFSAEWKPGMESFYPVNDRKNLDAYQKYFQRAKNQKKVIFGGRLAEYRYYDMDDTIEKALNDARKELG
jgi:UDP-galactopyranose mutase